MQEKRHRKTLLDHYINMFTILTNANKMSFNVMGFLNLMRILFKYLIFLISTF